MYNQRLTWSGSKNDRIRRQEQGIYDPNKQKIWAKQKDGYNLFYAKDLGVTPSWAYPIERTAGKTIYTITAPGGSKTYRSGNLDFIKQKQKEWNRMLKSGNIYSGS